MDGSIKIIKIDERAFLQIGDSSVELYDYNLKSSARGGTELEAIIRFNASIMKLSSEAKTEWRRQQS